MRYVIIGGGAAAVSCIDGIRSRDQEGSITVISKEAHPAYFRPLISYYLEGKSKKDNIYCRRESFYQDHHVKTVLGEAVTIDTNDKIVALNNGEMIPYDKLCVCSGSSPFVPPMAGLESVEKKFTFLTIDDAFAIEQAVDENSRVLIVGAGLIGLKCAEGLRDRVGSVTVCDLAPRVLSSILDDDCASIVQKHLEGCGITFSLSNTAERFEGNLALMKDGSTSMCLFSRWALEQTSASSKIRAARVTARSSLTTAWKPLSKGSMRRATVWNRRISPSEPNASWHCSRTRTSAAIPPA